MPGLALFAVLVSYLIYSPTSRAGVQEDKEIYKISFNSDDVLEFFGLNPESTNIHLLPTLANLKRAHAVAKITPRGPGELTNIFDIDPTKFAGKHTYAHLDRDVQTGSHAELVQEMYEAAFKQVQLIEQDRKTQQHLKENPPQSFDTFLKSDLYLAFKNFYDAHSVPATDEEMFGISKLVHINQDPFWGQGLNIEVPVFLSANHVEPPIALLTWINYDAYHSRIPSATVESLQAQTNRLLKLPLSTIEIVTKSYKEHPNNPIYLLRREMARTFFYQDLEDMFVRRRASVLDSSNWTIYPALAEEYFTWLRSLGTESIHKVLDILFLEFSSNASRNFPSGTDVAAPKSDFLTTEQLDALESARVTGYRNELPWHSEQIGLHIDSRSALKYFLPRFVGRYIKLDEFTSWLSRKIESETIQLPYDSMTANLEKTFAFMEMMENSFIMKVLLEQRDRINPLLKAQLPNPNPIETDQLIAKKQQLNRMVNAYASQDLSFRFMQFKSYVNNCVFGTALKQ